MCFKNPIFLPALKKIQELRNIWLYIQCGLSPTFAAGTFRDSWHKLNFAKLELNTHVISCKCIYNTVQLICAVQHTETRSAAA